MGEISLLLYPLMKEPAEPEPCVAELCWAQLWAPTWHWGWDGVRTSSVCFPGEGGAWTCSFQGLLAVCPMHIPKWGEPAVRRPTSPPPPPISAAF